MVGMHTRLLIAFASALVLTFPQATYSAEPAHAIYRPYHDDTKHVYAIAARPHSRSIEPSLVLSSPVPVAYLPIVIGGSRVVNPVNGCPATSTAQYSLISFQGGAYKGNKLTDNNADFRLQVLGYSAAPNTALTLVDINGPTDPNAPKLHGIFKPNRLPAFVKNYQRFDWTWNENGAPPYGTRAGVNQQVEVSVLDMTTNAGEGIYIPQRTIQNDGSGTSAMVLYADEQNITLAYTNQDRPDAGYVAYLSNLCVDPNLVTLYRTQLKDGKRATGKLPAIRTTERIGVAKSTVITVAIRDSGPFLDPRSRKDWWQGIALGDVVVVHIAGEQATRP